MVTMLSLIIALVLVPLLGSPARAGTYNVNAGDIGIPSDCEQEDPEVDDCTFSDAVNDAGRTPGPDTITINVTKNVVHTDRPVVVITGVGALFLEGITLDGAPQRSTVPGVPENIPPVTLAGGGIVLNGDDNQLMDLHIPGEPGSAVLLVAGDRTRLRGVWLGFTHFQGGVVGDSHAPSALSCYQADDLVVESTTAMRNVFAGTSGPAIFLDRCSHVTILDSRIGLLPSSMMFPPETTNGILISQSFDVAIGDAFPENRNVIAGIGVTLDGVNDLGGYAINADQSGRVEIVGNYIGTNGVDVIRNRAGIRTSNHTGTIEIIGNVISGSGDPEALAQDPRVGAGIYLGPTVGSFTATIQGNKIGTDPTGTVAMPNVRDNIVAVAGANSRVLIGGTEPGQGNVIAHSLFGSGVQMEAFDLGAVTVLGNSIFDNEGGAAEPSPNPANPGLGIAFLFSGSPLPNDDVTFPYDTDGGFNDFQNHPIIETAESDGAATHVVGRLRSTEQMPFRLEFFSSAECDPSGYGEGELFLGAVEGPAVQTNAQGELLFDAMLPVPIPDTHTAVTATATRRLSSDVTSEFSPCVVPETTGPIAGSDTCLVAQLRAASRLANVRLVCEAKHAANLDGARRDACLVKAEASFDKTYQKALDKAAKKGETCRLAGAAATARAALAGAADAAAASLLQGFEENDGVDRTLRKKLLKAAGVLAGAWLAAEAGDVKKPDPGKLAKNVEKARTKFDGVTAAAIERAAKKNLTYAGLPPADVAAAVRVFVDAFLALAGKD